MFSILLAGVPYLSLLAVDGVDVMTEECSPIQLQSKEIQLSTHKLWSLYCVLKYLIYLKYLIW